MKIVSPHCWLSSDGELLILFPKTSEELAGEGLCLRVPLLEGGPLYRVKGPREALDRYLLSEEWRNVEFEEVDLKGVREAFDLLWVLDELKKALATVREPELARPLSGFIARLEALAMRLM